MWIYLPTSCLSVPATAESTLDLNSLAQALSLNVTWRSKLQSPKSWLRVLKTGAWTMHRSGVISKALTLNPGEAISTWLLGDIRALPSLVPGSGLEPPTLDTCGPTLPESLENANLNGFSSKTSPDTLVWDFAKSPESYKKWATELRLDSLRRRKWALRTVGNASSCWRTPNVQESGVNPETLIGEIGHRLYTASGRNAQHGLPQQVVMWAKQVMWPTVRTTDGNAGRGCIRIGNSFRRPSKGLKEDRLFGANLSDAASAWPTPTCQDAKHATNSPGQEGRNGLVITALRQVAMWNTPRAQEDGSSPEAHAARIAKLDANSTSGGPHHKPTSLTVQAKGWDAEAVQVRKWPTPQACSPNSLRGSGQDPMKRREGGHAVTLQDAVSVFPSFPQDRTTPTAKAWEPETEPEKSKNWHTPTVEDNKTDGEQSLQRYGTVEMKTRDQRLRVQVRKWPTPQAFDALQIERSPEALERQLHHNDRKNARTTTGNLREESVTFPSFPRDRTTPTLGTTSSADTPNLLPLWSTPKADHSYRQGKVAPSEGVSHGRTLGGDVVAFQKVTSSTRRLNPMFVELLMGLPLRWTQTHPLERIVFERWAMESSLLVSRCLYQYCANSSAI